MNNEQKEQLQDSGYTWNEERNCWLHSNGVNCIFATDTEERFQTGTITEGTPVRSEGTYTFQEAIEQPTLAVVDSGSEDENHG